MEFSIPSQNPQDTAYFAAVFSFNLMNERKNFLRRPGYDCRLLGRYPVWIVCDRSRRCFHWSAQ